MGKAGWLLLAAGTGLLSGHLGRRLTLPAPDGKSVANSSPSVSQAPGKSATGHGYTSPAWSVRDGVDSAELGELPPGARRMAETALWLASADAAGIAARYAALIAEQPQDGDLLDLVMTRWMELDPSGALAVVAGKDLEERRAWMTWAMVDPEAAVKEAVERNSGYLMWIARGAAFTNPRLAMRLMDEHPGMKFPGIDYILGLGFQNEGMRGALDFNYSGKALREWAQEEPEEALEWALANPRKVKGGHDGGPSFWQGLVKDMDDAQVKQVITGLPQGQTRTDLEAVLLKRLIDRDVDAALEQARAAKSKAERTTTYVEVGKALVSRDPEKSFAALQELLADGGGKFAQSFLFPGQSTPDASYPQAVFEWVDRLAQQDPARVLEMIGSDDANSILRNGVADDWMGRDFNGFGKWAAKLPASPENDRIFYRAANWLDEHPEERSLETYTESIAWAERISSEDLRRDAVPNLIRNWIKLSPDSAATYFAANGGATSAQRAEYQRLKKEEATQ